MRATNVRLVDTDKPIKKAAPGMYAAQPDTEENALAEGLRKFIGQGETKP
jgi:hypothetical protein